MRQAFYFLGDHTAKGAPRSSEKIIRFSLERCLPGLDRKKISMLGVNSCETSAAVSPWVPTTDFSSKGCFSIY
jgi:hypothetical protein